MKNSFKKIFLFLIAVFVISSLAAGQSEILPDEAKARADDIISKYRAATGFDKIPSDIKFTSVEYERSYLIPQDGSKMSTIDKLSLGGNNEVRYEYVNSPRNLPTRYTEIWNKKTYYAKQSDKNGNVTLSKKFNFSKQEAANNDEVGDLYWKVFVRLFPITFKAAFYPAFQFRYAGTVESPDGSKADVIEKSFDGEDNNQFIFDQKTHLLLMWIRTYEKGKDIKRFSDYKEISGLFIPQKMETKQGIFDFTYLMKKITFSADDKPELFVIPEK